MAQQGQGRQDEGSNSNGPLQPATVGSVKWHQDLATIVCRLSGLFLCNVSLLYLCMAMIF